MEETATMVPVPRRRIPGAAARMRRNVPPRLMSSVSCQRTSSSSPSGTLRAIPALQMSASSGGPDASTAATSPAGSTADTQVAIGDHSPGMGTTGP